MAPATRATTPRATPTPIPAAAPLLRPEWPLLEPPAFDDAADLPPEPVAADPPPELVAADPPPELVAVDPPELVAADPDVVDFVVAAVGPEEATDYAIMISGPLCF
jgi:hypothetical protein